MTDKEKIRKEVERLQKELVKEKEKGFGSDVDDACILELQNVLIYIDSLQEEAVSNDLEEAVKKYLTSLRKSHFEGYDIERAFEKGAKWQKKQTIDKACEWLRTNYEDIGIRYIRGHKVEDEIESFKKAMEE